jgi:hypothetical protein
MHYFWINLNKYSALKYECLHLSFSFPPSVSISVFFVILSHCFLSLFFSFFLFLSLSFSFFPFLSLSFSFFLFLSLSFSFFLFLSLTFSFFLFLSLYFSFVLFLSLSFSFFLFLWYTNYLCLSNKSGNTKGGSITVPLTSCLTGLD